MQEISFEVQGSATSPYRVLFVKRSEENLSAYCSCPAGGKGQYCKHRFSILDGKSNGIVSGNIEDVKIVQSWLPGTDIHAAITKVRELEVEADKTKRALAAAKKEVAEVMRD